MFNLFLLSSLTGLRSLKRDSSRTTDDPRVRSGPDSHGGVRSSSRSPFVCVVYLHCVLTRLRFLVGHFLRAVYRASDIKLPCDGQLCSWLNGGWIRRPSDHPEYRPHRHVPVGHAPECRAGKPDDFCRTHPRIQVRVSIFVSDFFILKFLILSIFTCLTFWIFESFEFLES